MYRSIVAGGYDVSAFILSLGSLIAAMAGCRAEQAPNESGRAAPPNASARVPTESEFDKQWSEGEFASISQPLDEHVARHLRIERATVWTDEMDIALRSKIVAFLTAYSGTDFEAYLAFREPRLLADSTHPILQSLTKSWSETLGPKPTKVEDFARRAWDVAVNGLGEVFQVGPVLEEIRWDSLVATSGEVPKNAFRSANWPEAASEHGAMLVEYNAEAVRSQRVGLTFPIIPNRLSPEALVERDGRLIYADVAMITRSRLVPARPFRLRFLWDRESGAWLPTQALIIGNFSSKPFVW